MGTRAIIRIEGVNYAELYKHYDGYPKRTLPWLQAFNESFTKARGNDPSYKFAQLLRNTVIGAREFGLDDSDFTGWGINEFSSDCGQQFTYLLKIDGTVELI